MTRRGASGARGDEVMITMVITAFGCSRRRFQARRHIAEWKRAARAERSCCATSRTASTPTARPRSHKSRPPRRHETVSRIAGRSRRRLDPASGTPDRRCAENRHAARGRMSARAGRLQHARDAAQVDGGGPGGPTARGLGRDGSAADKYADDKMAQTMVAPIVIGCLQTDVANDCASRNGFHPIRLPREGEGVSGFRVEMMISSRSGPRALGARACSEHEPRARGAREEKPAVDKGRSCVDSCRRSPARGLHGELDVATVALQGALPDI